MLLLSDFTELLRGIIFDQCSFKILTILGKGEIEVLFKDHNDRDIALRPGSWGLGSSPNSAFLSLILISGGTVIPSVIGEQDSLSRGVHALLPALCTE